MGSSQVKFLTFTSFLVLCIFLGSFAQSRAEHRSLDGTGNNQLHPEFGAPFTPFTRFPYLQRLGLPDVAYEDGLSTPARPENSSARDISNLVHRETTFRYNHRDLSDLLTTWTFLMHIDTSLGLALSVLMPNPPIFEIPVAPDDPVFGCNEEGLADDERPCLPFRRKSTRRYRISAEPFPRKYSM
jgi:hypothetical protein